MRVFRNPVLYPFYIALFGLVIGFVMLSVEPSHAAVEGDNASQAVYTATHVYADTIDAPVYDYPRIAHLFENDRAFVLDETGMHVYFNLCEIEYPFFDLPESTIERFYDYSDWLTERGEDTEDGFQKNMHCHDTIPPM